MTSTGHAKGERTDQPAGQISVLCDGHHDLLGSLRGALRLTTWTTAADRHWPTGWPGRPLARLPWWPLQARRRRTGWKPVNRNRCRNVPPLDSALDRKGKLTKPHSPVKSVFAGPAFQPNEVRPPVHPSIAAKRSQIAEICRRFHVRRLEVFGSAARADDFDETRSDADFLVELAADAPMGLFNAYFGLKHELQALLGREVDLVSPSAVENPFVRATIDRSRGKIYDSKLSKLDPALAARLPDARNAISFRNVLIHG